MKQMMNRWIQVTVTGMFLAVAGISAQAQEIKIGYVSLERILRDSVPAKEGSKKLESEFAGRDKELQELAARLKEAAQSFDRDAPVLTEADRVKRQRELQEMDRDLQRRQREFREDLNLRRNEEVQTLIDRAQRVVQKIAQDEKFDLILQDAVYQSARVDITERVLKALNDGQ